ncbi:MAG: selenoneine biosynthesis selenosugar synthase SenB [Planctomycetaceae bacterium]
MRLLIVTPAPKGSRKGNRITADRWTRLLRQLGHRVTTATAFRDQPCDVLIGLHARKSAASIRRYRANRPDGRLVVVLTGTDLYHDLPRSQAAQRSLELADRLVVLQSHAIEALPVGVRDKARVIVQSAVASASRPAQRKEVFDVCVMGHLRPVKDPFRTALAARKLPAGSEIVVSHLGAALDPDMERRATAEMVRNPRYRWLGDLPHASAMRVLARSRLLVNSSKMEGGANAICEALACGVPVLSSRIAGSIGLLGEDYPGYFDVGDTLELAVMLSRFETDAAFREQLQSRCRTLARIVEPERELAAWQQLLAEL